MSLRQACLNEQMKIFSFYFYFICLLLSGMDPQARHETWDILQRFKHGTQLNILNIKYTININHNQTKYKIQKF